MKNLRVFAAVLGGAAVAWGGLSYITLTIGVLAEGYHFSLSQATSLATLELSAMAVASLTGGYGLRFMSVRRMAVTGGVIAGIANIATAISADFAVIVVLRALAGIGFGWMSAGLSTSVSRTADPERLFVQANFGNVGFGAIFFAIMPMIYGGGRFTAYFVAYGFICWASAALMVWLPQAPAGETRRKSARTLDMAGLTLLLSVSLVWLCYAAVWALVERLGRDIGMSEEAVGTTLGVGTLAGLLAVIVAALLAKYVRPMWPLIATSFATGVTYYWMVYCHTQPVFIWIMILQGITLCPILAYAYAVAAELDRSGNLARLIAGGTAIATAFGPLVGGRLELTFGYQGVVEAAFGGSTVACVALAVLAYRRRSEARRKSLIPDGAPSNG
jgi:MFS family permease